jgi:pyruvate dehydrogenase (quinone)
VGLRGVAVIVISGDTALKDAVEAPAPRVGGLLPGPSIVLPAPSELERLADLLNASRRVTLLCGSGCCGTHEELLALGAKLKSPIVHALRGKEHVEWDNPDEASPYICCQKCTCDDAPPQISRARKTFHFDGL